jgi:uncharacterized protein (UPF0261 family)
MACIHVAGTADTKGEELAFLRDLLAAGGQEVRVVDLGTRRPRIPVAVSAAAVAGTEPERAVAVLASAERSGAEPRKPLAIAQRWTPPAGEISAGLAQSAAGCTANYCGA